MIYRIYVDDICSVYCIWGHFSALSTVVLTILDILTYVYVDDIFSADL